MNKVGGMRRGGLRSNSSSLGLLFGLTRYMNGALKYTFFYNYNSYYP